MHFKPRNTVLAMLLASTSLIVPTLAFAQAGVVELDEITVEADGTADGQAAGQGEGQQTTGSKTAADIKEVPQSVSVVPKAELQKHNGGKADEALRYTAGVNTQTYGTDADTDWFFVRGLQANQSGVFLDGLQLYQTGFGTFLVDPYLLDGIEVLKGPASALYGGSNHAGIINYVGKRPTGERLVETEAGINNFGNAYVGFDVGDGTDAGDLAYRLTGKVSGGGWETDGARDLRGVIQGAVTWKGDQGTELTVYGNYQRIDLDHTSTGFLPYVGTAVDGPGGIRIPRNFNYGEPGFDVYDRHQAMIGYELEHEINGEWTVRQNARYAGVSLDEAGVYSAGTLLPGGDLTRFAFGHNTDVGTITVDTQLEGHVSTGPVDHTLLFGFDFKNYNIDQRQGSLFPAPSINVLNPVYGAPIGPLGYYIDSVTNMRQAGIYAQGQMRFDDWILTVNGRYDFTTTDVNDRLAPLTSTTRNEGFFTGRVGLGYEFDNGVTPYVSYATSYNPVLDRDGTGALYASETGEQFEAGIKYEPTFMDGLITASVFNINRNNVLGPNPALPGTQAPVGQVNIQGAELEALANVDDFTIRGALTYLDATVLVATGTTAVGNTPVQIPTLTASLGVDYHFVDGPFDGLSVGAGVRYLGSSWADNANTTRVPEVALLDVGMTYEQDDWSAALNVTNLLDTSFVSSCQSLGSCGYGPGRTVTLSLKKKW